MAAKKAKLQAELKRIPHKIVYERYRGNTWELVMMNADGSAAVSLTGHTDLNALYPHASPDGKRICFVADEGTGESKSRNVYYMNADGAGRTLVARNARQPCWTSDGHAVAYMKGEFARFTYEDFASKGLFLYDLDSREHREHPNRSLHHLYNIGWSPDGGWVLATVHGGMGYRHAILAIEARGTGVFDLKPAEGCRPDLSPDGKKLAWNATDQLIAVADLDLQSTPPKVANVRPAITCDKQHEVYHADWSPDGRYIAFAHGPLGPEQVGKVAKGWNICVADAAATDVWVPLTSDGASNKEPDWVPAGGTKGR
ncbi:MAG: hypothetical protein AMJ81_08785 [Phycisphaerae bacterium SM23_33]|nr:MAG: hypothetical protein AMJ81_08785 [Phycisphaerae bacterium SM23_33]